MMAMHFQYTDSPSPNGRYLRRPWIPVTFSNGKTSWQAFGLLDSGADITSISLEMANHLGLDISGEQSTCYGVTGSVKSVRSKVDVVVADKDERHVVTVPVKVLMMDGQMFPLLGQVGFFDEFEVTFKRRDDRVMLKKSGIDGEPTKTGMA